MASVRRVRSWTPAWRAHQLHVGRHDWALGSISNIAQQPHVHPQWLYFFRTARLPDALAKVRAHGGLTLPPMENGRRDLVAVCDDPQGAAFAFYEFRIKTPYT